MNLVSLGIGAIIGAGIFVLTGSAAADTQDPLSCCRLSYPALPVFAGLCYADLLPYSDCRFGLYLWLCYLGRDFAWIIGWDLILEYAFGAATVASGLERLSAQLYGRLEGFNTTGIDLAPM